MHHLRDDWQIIEPNFSYVYHGKNSFVDLSQEAITDPMSDKKVDVPKMPTFDSESEHLYSFEMKKTQNLSRIYLNLNGTK